VLPSWARVRLAVVTMTTKAVLVFWVGIVVVCEYAATFERKQLSLLTGIYICMRVYMSL
jgi:hypothetical protein